MSYVSAPIDTASGRGAVIAFTGIEDPARGARAARRDAILAEEPAALRRVAAVLAAGAASADVFAGVTREVGQALGIRSEVGAPAIVDGRIWGALIAGADEPEPLRAGAGALRRARGDRRIERQGALDLLASCARIAAATDEQRQARVTQRAPPP